MKMKVHQRLRTQAARRLRIIILRITLLAQIIGVNRQVKRKARRRLKRENEAEAGVPAKVQTRVMESSQHVKVRLVKMRVVRKRVVNLWVRTEIANQQR